MNLSFDVIEDIKIFHSPESLFIGRPFELSLVTEIDESLLSSVLLFSKQMKWNHTRNNFNWRYWPL